MRPRACAPMSSKLGTMFPRARNCLQFCALTDSILHSISLPHPIPPPSKAEVVRMDRCVNCSLHENCVIKAIDACAGTRPFAGHVGDVAGFSPVRFCLRHLHRTGRPTRRMPNPRRPMMRLSLPQRPPIRCRPTMRRGWIRGRRRMFGMMIVRVDFSPRDRILYRFLILPRRRDGVLGV